MSHLLFEQTASPFGSPSLGPGHFMQVGPQRLASVSGAHSIAFGQECQLARHEKSQVRLEQVAFPPLAGPEHAVVQSPQCVGSVSRLAHPLPHKVGIAAGHDVTHCDAAHNGASEEHALVQLPQCVAVVTSVSQPVSGSAPQCAKPVAHDVAGMTQWPSAHVIPSAEPTCIKAAQSWLHAPQFWGSLDVSMQRAPHCE
jgi:hypothetical protein